MKTHSKYPPSFHQDKSNKTNKYNKKLRKTQIISHVELAPTTISKGMLCVKFRKYCTSRHEIHIQNAPCYF